MDALVARTQCKEKIPLLAACVELNSDQYLEQTAHLLDRFRLCGKQQVCQLVLVKLQHVGGDFEGVFARVSVYDVE